MGYCFQRTVPASSTNIRSFLTQFRGYQLPKHWQPACYSTPWSSQSRDPLPRLVMPDYPK